MPGRSIGGASPGGTSNVSLIAPLNWRRLPKPDANATSAMSRSVSSSGKVVQRIADYPHDRARLDSVAGYVPVVAARMSS
jgi:hypothetical protein